MVPLLLKHCSNSFNGKSISRLIDNKNQMTKKYFWSLKWL